jgi:hypothetical protein
VKIGDLVKLSSSHGASFRAGLVVDLVEKKCWRTDVLGSKVDWSKIEPEPHAVVLINGNKIAFPLTDLKAVDEDR